MPTADVDMRMVLNILAMSLRGMCTRDVLNANVINVKEEFPPSPTYKDIWYCLRKGDIAAEWHYYLAWGYGGQYYDGWHFYVHLGYLTVTLF